MRSNDNEQLQAIVTILSGLRDSFSASYTTAVDTLPLKTLEKLGAGDRITWSQVFSMMSSGCLRSAKETIEASLSEPSIETPSKNSIHILSLSQLLTMSLHLETLAKRLASLKQKLTPTAASERVITSQALQQAASLLALMTLEQEAISRILRNDFGVSLSQTPE